MPHMPEDVDQDWVALLAMMLYTIQTGQREARFLCQTLLADPKHGEIISTHPVCRRMLDTTFADISSKCN